MISDLAKLFQYSQSRTGWRGLTIGKAPKQAKSTVCSADRLPDRSGFQTASKQSELPHSVPRQFSAIILAAAVTLIAGCSGGSPTSAAVDSAKAADEGVRALEARDWAKAETQFTSALDSKTLSGDRYEEVLLGRARARFEKGDLDHANEDIQTLERGAAAMDQVLLLKAQVQLKKGDVAAAKATFQQAKQINGSLEAPPGL